MYTDGSRNVGKGGCSPSRLINFSSITILSRMEALVEALKLAENIIWGGLKLYDHKGGAIMAFYGNDCGKPGNFIVIPLFLSWYSIV